VRRLLLITPTLFAAAAFCPTAARADDATASGEDKRPNAALAACASGDVAKGISILGELYAETRNPSFVFNQGRCYQKNNQLEQARSSFSEYIRIGTNEPPEDIQRANAFVKEIDDALARQRASQPAAVTTAPTSAPSDGGKAALRISSVVLAAVGVVAVGFGAFMSMKVNSTNDDLKKEFAQPYVTDVARVQQLQSDGDRYQTLQWVGYGVGAAAVAGAVTTFILGGYKFPWSAATSDRVAVDLAPSLSPDGGGAFIRMRF
jgi:hypothetical protein